MPGKTTRTIDGNRFTFKTSRKTRPKAETAAENLRKKGMKARVMKVPQYKGYSVFTRRG